MERFAALREHVYHGAMGLVPLWDRILDAAADTYSPLEFFEMEVYLRELLLKALDIADAHDEGRVSQPIQDELDYMEKHIADDFNLDAMAKRADFSPTYFKRRFRQEVGLPPGQHLVRRRVAIASQRLQETDDKITDIAFDLGFNTSQHFATAFKRFVGVTPRQYRKNE